MAEPTIIAIGGAGELGPDDTERIDRDILARAGKLQPNVLFIPTASRDDQDYCDRFARWYGSYGANVSTLALTTRDYIPSELETIVAAHDIIYVSGGNTLYLCNLWQGYRLDAILRAAWQRGKILCGVSAGANCWHARALTDSVAGEMRMMFGLGFVPGYVSPHYDSEPERRPALYDLVTRGIGPWLALEDGTAAVYRGTELAEIIVTDATRHAFHVELRDGAVVETPLPARVLT